MKSIKQFLALALTAFAISAAARQPAIIPQPQTMKLLGGEVAITKGVSISCNDVVLKPAADYLAAMIGRSTGYAVKQKKGDATITLSLAGSGKDGSYTLKVDSKGIKITGVGYRGVVNGIATLRQLFAPEIESKSVVAAKTWTVPCVEISDAPRFEWRGMELDCSRHFFTKEEVEALLDVLALYKIDKFHWHLTDDQGWRVEIKKYPLLTSNGAWRTYNNQDSVCIARAAKEDNPALEIQRSKIRKNAEGQDVYGGFYTQDDVREIVEYARVRGIEVIPEVDMPGHSLVAIRNYDGLSCFKQVGWGQTFSTPMCPGKDKMIDFCKDIWTELFDLFPSKYVHMGGDEVEMQNWAKCPDCQKRMTDNHLTTLPQLQAWFNHTMENFFTSHGRQMIGWDEIIEGGLTPGSVVMWWRSWAPQSPKQATAHGNNVICTPNSEFYIDYQEDINSVPKIYSFNPLGGGLTDAEQKLVLGVQGNLWTEWVPSVDRMWYQAFPRIMAVAELGWSMPEVKSLPDFQKRLVEHYKRLQVLGVKYRLPDITGFFASNVFTDKAVVNVSCADPSAVIRYTTDGSIPQASSPSYTGPMTIIESANFAFRTFGSDGRKGDITRASWIKEDFAPSVSVAETRQGLTAEWRNYTGPDCAGIDTAKVCGVYSVDNVSIPQEAKGNIGLIITGYIEVPADGIYTFSLLSDDGSYLMIDGKMIVDNDGEHSPRELIGQHAMRRGLHPILVRYFDHNGGSLRLNVMDAEGKAADVKYFSNK